MGTTALSDFLLNHDFKDIDIELLSQKILDDMTAGLEQADKSQQLMAVMPFPIKLNRKNGKIIVIDAGGTNFRSCLVEILDDKINITEERKSSMIALDRELSKNEFFEQLEEKISYLKDKAPEIHFCFSYAMKNTADGDAQVVVFSKQVKAKEVIGSYVGKELLSVLEKKGWTSVKKIKLINDATACLFAGLSLNNPQYDTYAGLILGTGINNAYIQRGKIQKNPDDLDEHLVVCECGMFKDLPQSHFDKMVDEESTNKGQSLLEKMCSGVYVGKVCDYMVRQACKEGLFSSEFAAEFGKCQTINPVKTDLFLKRVKNSENVLEELCCRVEEKTKNQKDRNLLTEIFRIVIERSSKITAAVLLATAVKACPDRSKKICLNCNGSTFWKTSGLKENVEKYLNEFLTQKRGINFEITQVENDITIGTALV